MNDILLLDLTLIGLHLFDLPIYSLNSYFGTFLGEKSQSMEPEMAGNTDTASGGERPTSAKIFTFSSPSPKPPSLAPLINFRGSEPRDSNVSGTSRSWVNEKHSFAPTLSSHQTVWLKWSQSDLVNVVVDSTEHSFRLPRDFLTHRSIPFDAMLNGRFSEATTGVVRLPTTNTATFQYVAIWMMSPEPQLEKTLPLPTAVDIAIFATMYDIPSLLHQALDRMRTCIAWDPKALTTELLDEIYGHVDEHCLLRQFMRAAVSVLSASWSASKVTDGTMKKWLDVFERHAALGADYFAAHVVKTWSNTSLAEGGPCRFHRHVPQSSSRPVPLFPSPLTSSDSCPRRIEECFRDVQMACSEQDTNAKASQPMTHDSRKIATIRKAKVSMPT